jgi:hypothetical protein
LPFPDQVILWTGCKKISAIFANFRRKKIAFFSKINVIIKFLHKLVVWEKTPMFLQNFLAIF